jgi:hypothetical protein
MQIAKNRFQRVVQKTCGVCFDGAHATKKLVPRLYMSHWEKTCMPPAATKSNSQWAYRYLAAAAGGFVSKNYKNIGPWSR